MNKTVSRLTLYILQSIFRARLSNFTRELQKKYFKFFNAKWSEKMHNDWILLFGSPPKRVFPGLEFNTDTGSDKYELIISVKELKVS